MQKKKENAEENDPMSGNLPCGRVPDRKFATSAGDSINPRIGYTVPYLNRIQPAVFLIHVQTE
jgi:hypothetical protein